MNKLTILVAEDDSSVKNLMTTTLRTHDYHFLTAGNGQSAIMEASSHNPDIVLLDLGLPDMDRNRLPIYNLPIQAAYTAPQVQTSQEPERYAPAPVLALKIRRWLKLNDLAGIVLRLAVPFLIRPSPLTHLFIRLLLATQT